MLVLLAPIYGELLLFSPSGIRASAFGRFHFPESHGNAPNAAIAKKMLKDKLITSELITTDGSRLGAEYLST